MKKTLQAIAIALMIAVMYDSGVKAAESLVYTLQAIPLSTSVSSSILAESNHAFIVNRIYASEGGPAVRDAYQTKYDGSWIYIGDFFKTTNGEASINVYYPLDNRNWPSGTDKYLQCSGQNTNEDYCAISGSEYRVVMDNKNIFNSLEVDGKFYFSN